MAWKKQKVALNQQAAHIKRSKEATKCPKCGRKGSLDIFVHDGQLVHKCRNWDCDYRISKPVLDKTAIDDTLYP